MIRGEATATLADGRTLTLAMNFSALAFAAAKSKIPASEIFAVLAKDDGRQMIALLALIEGALKKYHRDISEDEIDELMFDGSEILSEAMSVAMNSAFSDEKAEPGNALNGTGTNSKRAGRKQA